MTTQSLMIIVELAVINWLLLLAASLMRARAWTAQGMMIALGNREGLPTPIGLAGRTDRTARNMLENLVLFSVITLVAFAAGVTDPKVELGARLFFWGRVLYIPIYMAGIPLARTAAWAVGVVGMGMIVTALFQALPVAL